LSQCENHEFQYSKFHLFHLRIYSIQTSYATVPRKGLLSSEGLDEFSYDCQMFHTGESGTRANEESLNALSQHYPGRNPSIDDVTSKKADKSRSKPLHRARITITIQRTDLYRKWLEDNPDHFIEVCEEHDNET